MICAEPKPITLQDRSINNWTVNVERGRHRSSLSKFNKEAYAMQEQGTLLKLIITELELFTSDHLVYQDEGWGCLSELKTEVPYSFLLKLPSEPLSTSLTSCTYSLHPCFPFLFTCRPHPHSPVSQSQLSVVTNMAPRLMSLLCGGFRNNK